MKILVVCQHYWPEPFQLPDLCEELVARGHEVDIITGVPNYPMGITYSEYKHGQNRRQTRNGVNIIRTLEIARRNNIVFRFLNYYSFAISSTLFALKLKKEYDVVFTNQTSPVMMSNAAVAYSKKHNVPSVLYCMDLWPASVAAGGVDENSPIYKHFYKESKKVYTNVDKILVTSKMFKEYFIDTFNIIESKIGYLPQFADSQFDNIKEKTPNDVTDLVFAGNIGVAQSLETILRAAKILYGKHNIRWHIVGDGSDYERLIALKEKLGLDNVIFYGRKPIEDMPKYYEMADAMLVTLTRDPLISRTLPGKVQSYMAAGKAIIAAADGETPKVINESGAGFCAHADNADEFAKAVENFVLSKNKLEFGRNAKKYYEQNFTRKMFMDKIENELKTIKK